MATRKTPSSSSVSSGSSLCSSRSSLGASHGQEGTSDGQGHLLQSEQVDWKERCHALEASLHKFKQQATRIRELLSEKMKDLEKRTQNAEARAKTAEVKQKQTEDQLMSSNWQPKESDKKMHQLEAECTEKTRIIQHLQDILDEQKLQRLGDAKKIEEKSCRIKDWVSKKVKNLECENSQLKLDNTMMNQQVETLRTRLQLLPVSAAREIHRLSMQEIDDDSLPPSPLSSSTNISAPPVPKRPSSSLLQTFRIDQEIQQQKLALISDSEYACSSTQEPSPDSDESMALNDEFEPDYQEVDDNRQSKYEPKNRVALGPPQVRIERRAFPRYRSSVRSSVGGPDDIFLDDKSPDSLKSPPLFKTLPKNVHLNAHSHKTTALAPGTSKAVTESMQQQSKGNRSIMQNIQVEKVLGKKAAMSQSETHEYDDPPPPSPTSIKSSQKHKKKAAKTVSSSSGSNTSHSVAASQSMHHKMLKTVTEKEDIMNSNTVIEQYKRLGSSYEEPAYATPPSPTIYQYTSLPYNNRNIPAFATMPRRKKNPLEQYSTASSTATSSSKCYNESSTHSALLSRSFSERRPKPPTPPLRRMPSWETRIYAIANVGLQLPDNGRAVKRHSGVTVTEGLYAEHIYNDLAVPVYTTLRGKATRIRSIPFTGESSSESDDNCSQSSVAAGITSESENEAVVSVAGPSNSGKSVNGLMRVRKHLNHTSSGAIKRGVSSHSITSESSSDYAVPPDEVESVLNYSSGDSEPEHKLLKYATTTSAKDSLERCGYLTKLGGKVKNWRHRWVVLKGGDILYYKSPSDVARKPQGYISLDSHSKVVKCEGANTFQIITVKKTYYLTAESAEDMDQWIRVIQNVLKKQAADQVFSQTKGQEAVKGWLIKTKHGRSRRCYAVVIAKFLMYYKTVDDNTPLGQIGLQGAAVEEVDRSCDSESDSDNTMLPDYTLAIKPAGGDPTYLMMPTKHEKDSWLYHLTVACGGNCGSVGTDYEQLVSKLMEMDGDPTCVYWKHPTLLHKKELMTRPLTTLSSEGLQIRALELFKSCQLFLNMAIESTQIDYHVTLAQNILNTCLQIRELQNELYCQLVKQTAPHPLQQKSAVQNLLCGSQSWFLCSDNSPTSPENSAVDLLDSKLNPSSLVFLQGWQLLAMAVSLFLPSQSILWYLKAHLQRHADPRNEIGKYAVFCQRAIERTKSSGGREARPSRMEVLSILLRNPFHHSQPISIPVHFLNGSYQVVSFDGSTTVDEFLQSLNKTLGMRDSRLSGFALFTDDPAGQKLEHCLRGHLKICDVISKWEQAFLHHATQRSGKVDLHHTVRFTYKNRLYFKSQIRNETERERLLLSYQINCEIVEGRFPLNKELAIELAALMAQVEYGDLRGPDDSLKSVSPKRLHTKDNKDIPSLYTMQYIPTVLERYYPKRYRDGSPSKNKSLEQKLCDKWGALQGRNGQDCVRIYLTVTRKWLFFGAKLFSAKVKYGDAGRDQVWLAVQEDSISVLEYATLKAISTFDYKEVVTFGGCREDFMLVVNHKVQNEENHLLECKTERLLFTMSKPKMLELTLLTANYINTRSQLPDLSQQHHPPQHTVNSSPRPGASRAPMYISSSIQV